MQRTRFKAAAFLFTLSVTLSVIFSGCSSRLNGVALVTGAVMDERNSKYVEAEQKLNQALSNVPESNQTFKVANQWLLAEFLTRRKRYRDAEKLAAVLLTSSGKNILRMIRKLLMLTEKSRIFIWLRGKFPKLASCILSSSLF